MQTKTKSYIPDNPYFYTLLGLFSAKLVSLAAGGGYLGSALYSLSMAAVPLAVFLKRNHRFEVKRGGADLGIIGVSLAVFAVGNTANSAVNMLLSPLGFETAVQIGELSGVWDYVPAFAVSCVIAPVCEEILFRGVVYKSAQKLGGAVVISAVAFALAHENVTVFAMPLIYGLFLGTVMKKTGSLLNCIIIHMLCNTLSFVLNTVSYPQLLDVIIAVSGVVFMVFALKKLGKSVRLPMFDLWAVFAVFYYIFVNIINYGG